jgi:hypothetical protein
MKRRLFTILYLVMPMIAGCRFSGRELAVSSSPDGHATVVVTAYSHGADADVSIRFKQGSFSADVDFIGDYGPYYPEIYWKTNSIVGVVVCSTWGGDISAGYDFATRQKVLISTLQEGIDNQIRQKYSPSPTELARYSDSPFTWRCNNERDRAETK